MDDNNQQKVQLYKPNPDYHPTADFLPSNPHPDYHQYANLQHYQPNPGYMPYGSPQETAAAYRGKAIASLVLGICSLTMIGAIMFGAPLVIAVIGLIISISVRRHLQGSQMRGMATAGFTLSLVTLGIHAVIGLIVLIAALSS